MKKLKTAPAPVAALPVVTHEPILTAEELASALKLPNAKTISELTRKRERKDGRPPMPALRAGKFLRFRLSDVLRWMEAAA
jgi:hypothetical protein